MNAFFSKFSWRALLGAALLCLSAGAAASSIDNVLAMPVQEREAIADAAFANKRYRKAKKEYKILARLGSKRAQLRLSEMRLNGWGMRRDPAMAWAWASIAAEFRPALAQEYRQQIWDSLDAGERTQAKEELVDLHKEYSDMAVTQRLRARSLALMPPGAQN